MKKKRSNKNDKNNNNDNNNDNNMLSDDSVSSDVSDVESQNILDESNYIGPFTDKLIKDFIKEIRKEKNMDRIRENIIDPILCDINDRYFPHMVTLITLLILIVLLLTFIIIINFFDDKKPRND